MIQPRKTVSEIGAREVKNVFHGTYAEFTSFSDERVGSVGHHFGDFKQAYYFATKRGLTFPAGRVVEVNLIFHNLLDIGHEDWGWTDFKNVALICYLKFMQSHIPINNEAFEAMLGPKPWNRAMFEPRPEMTAKERRDFAALLRAHDVDGISYINKYEPPGEVGGQAYFVLSDQQIEVIRFFSSSEVESLRHESAR